MHQRLFTLPSLLNPLQALSDYFGDYFVLRESTRGTSMFELCFDRVTYLQTLGVLPDPDRPLDFSLRHTPLLTHLDFIHPGNTLTPYRNGTLTYLFLGPSRSADRTWDCNGHVSLKAGYIRANQKEEKRFSYTPFLQEALTPAQQEILHLTTQKLETLLTTPTLEKR